MRTNSILLVGDLEHPDFHVASTWLRQHCLLSTANDAEHAVRLAGERAPDIILIAQIRPGQFSQRTIERLHRATPLSRLVTLLGSWCEGEPRTGHPWPGVIRIYWHQFEARFAREISDIARTWNLPRTSTENERLLVVNESPPTRGHGLIAIHARTRTAYETLADACSDAGYSSVWYRPQQSPYVRGALAGIWDEPNGRTEDQEITRFVGQLDPAPVIGLVSFPRRSDRESLRNNGICTVVSKPFLVNDFWSTLASVVPARLVRTDVAA